VVGRRGKERTVSILLTGDAVVPTANKEELPQNIETPL
jgi:hypothetical protein